MMWCYYCYNWQEHKYPQLVSNDNQRRSNDSFRTRIIFRLLQRCIDSRLLDKIIHCTLFSDFTLYCGLLFIEAGTKLLDCRCLSLGLNWKWLLGQLKFWSVQDFVSVDCPTDAWVTSWVRIGSLSMIGCWTMLPSPGQILKWSGYQSLSVYEKFEIEKR